MANRSFSSQGPPIENFEKDLMNKVEDVINITNCDKQIAEKTKKQAVTNVKDYLLVRKNKDSVRMDSRHKKANRNYQQQEFLLGNGQDTYSPLILKNDAFGISYNEKTHQHQHDLLKCVEQVFHVEFSFDQGQRMLDTKLEIPLENDSDKDSEASDDTEVGFYVPKDDKKTEVKMKNPTADKQLQLPPVLPVSRFCGMIDNISAGLLNRALKGTELNLEELMGHCQKVIQGRFSTELLFGRDITDKRVGNHWAVLMSFLALMCIFEILFIRRNGHSWWPRIATEPKIVVFYEPKSGGNHDTNGSFSKKFHSFIDTAKQVPQYILLVPLLVFVLIFLGLFWLCIQWPLFVCICIAAVLLYLYRNFVVESTTWFLEKCATGKRKSKN